MKKPLILLATAIALFSFAAFAVAADQKAATTAKTEPAKTEVSATEPKTQITGEVTAFEAAKSISVKGKSAEMTVAVNKSTKVTGGKAEDIKAGVKVTVMFKDAAGTKTAKSIEIKKTVAEPAKASAPAKPAAKAAEPAKK